MSLEDIEKMPEGNFTEVARKQAALKAYIAKLSAALPPDQMGLKQMLGQADSLLGGPYPVAQRVLRSVSVYDCDKAKAAWMREVAMVARDNYIITIKELNKLVQAYNSAVVTFLTARAYDNELWAEMIRRYDDLVKRVDGETIFQKVVRMYGEARDKLSAAGMKKELDELSAPEIWVPPSPEELGRDLKTKPRLLSLGESFGSGKRTLANKIVDLLQEIDNFTRQKAETQRAKLEDFRTDVRQKWLDILARYQALISLSNKMGAVGYTHDWEVEVPR